jgi:hypothetical protein
MWRGLAQQLEERRTTPAVSILENSSLAAFNFSWSNRQNFAVTGRPVVSM